MVDGDGWICLNDGEKKIVQRMRLKTEKKGLYVLILKGKW